MRCLPCILIMMAFAVPALAGCGGGTGREHETATWVLAQGGQVEVVDASGNSVLVTPDDSVPAGSIRVRRVAWDIYPGDRNDAIGDAELPRFAALSQLEELDLWTSAVTDAGLPALAGMTSLKHLNLSETKISDAGLSHLKSLPGLEQLYLMGTKVSDAGISTLAQMKQLKHLDVTRTRVTKAGAQKLKRALPSCIVMYAAEAKSNP